MHFAGLQRKGTTRLAWEKSSPPAAQTNLLDVCGPLVARRALGTGGGALVGNVRVVGLVGHDSGCLLGLKEVVCGVKVCGRGVVFAVVYSVVSGDVS